MIGLPIGVRIGLGIGGGAAVSDPLAGLVAQDATSGKYAPATAAEWTSALAALGISSGNPASLWLLQEAAGDFADSIGSNVLTNSTLTYQLPVTGWTRVAAGRTNDAHGEIALNTSIGNIGSTSGLLLAYVRLPTAPAADRDVMGLGGGSSHRYVALTSAGKLKLATNDASATATGSIAVASSVIPVVLQIDRTSNVCRILTDSEKITQAPYTAPPAASALTSFGRAISDGAAAAYLYAAEFVGAAAQLSDSQIRSLLQALGWDVGW